MDVVLLQHTGNGIDIIPPTVWHCVAWIIHCCIVSRTKQVNQPGFSIPNFQDLFFFPLPFGWAPVNGSKMVALGIHEHGAVVFSDSRNHCEGPSSLLVLELSIGSREGRERGTCP